MSKKKIEIPEELHLIFINFAPNGPCVLVYRDMNGHAKKDVTEIHFVRCTV